MSGPIATALGSVRLLGDNATLIWGMTNAERCRRLAESAAKGGSALAPGHELLLNLAFAFAPMLLREVRDRPGTPFAGNGVPVAIGRAPCRERGWQEEKSSVVAA